MVSSSLYNLSSISTIDFVFNQLSGVLPSNIGLTLHNLELFFIGENEFFGPIPGSLCNASKLQILDLGGNNFVGSVPTNLGYLLDLEHLRLSYNNLGRDSDFLTSLGNCSKMESLTFQSNQFEGVLPNSIGNLSSQLNAMKFGSNQISGMFPAALQNLINLNSLAMNENLFIGVIPTYYGKFQKMQGLYLWGNKLSSQGKSQAPLATLLNWLN